MDNKAAMNDSSPAKNTVFHIVATEDGERPVINMTVRERLLKQLCQRGVQDAYVSGCAEGAATITANENRMTVHYLQDVEAIGSYVSAGDQLITIRDDGLYLDKKLYRLIDQAKGSIAIGPDEGYPVRDYDRSTLEKIIFSNLAKDTDGIVSKTLNRPISGFISRHVARYGASPMFFTWVTGLMSFLMLCLLLSDHPLAIVGGCLLFHLVSVLDGVDGEIARSTYRKSALGARLDTGLDMMANVMFMGGLQYALWNFYGTEFLVLGGYIILLALTGIVMMTGLLYFGPGGGSFDVLAQTIRQRLDQSPFWLATFNNLNYFFKRDCFAFIFAVVGLLGLERLIPGSLIFGLVVWNLAILINARHILQMEKRVA